MVAEVLEGLDYVLGGPVEVQLALEVYCCYGEVGGGVVEDGLDTPISEQ